jgi:hypothetical protein
MIDTYLDARSSPNWETSRTYHTLGTSDRNIGSNLDPRHPAKMAIFRAFRHEFAGRQSERYLKPVKIITTTGNVTAASSVPSATAPDTGFTRR